ncbi:MAG: TrkA family potassium uptake protein [Chloroflexota bacterium]|nr:TrkA family potassium uptake protein [Chloroflexota bacterium]
MSRHGQPRETERVAVIGLGRFGASVARTLQELGYEVTAIDSDERNVAEASDYVTLAAQGDGADEDLLRSLAIDRAHFGIVAEAVSLESGALTTLLLKRLGVPWVVAIAGTELHGELLRRVGANRVVFPERDAGIRLGHSLSVRYINDYIPLSPFTGVAKLVAPNHFVGSTLGELCAPHAGKLDVLLIQRGNQVITAPGADDRIVAGDELLVVGADPVIDAFAEPGPPS